MPKKGDGQGVGEEKQGTLSPNLDCAGESTSQPVMYPRLLASKCHHAMHVDHHVKGEILLRRSGRMSYAVL